MALTPSNMLPLGTEAPDFSLTDVVSGTTKTVDDVTGPKGTVVAFICAHCPYVIHVQDELARIAAHYQAQGIGFVAISSNDVENYPQDAPDKLAEQARSVGFDFPYLHDADQSVARAYDAACTPDFYLFDENRLLVYRGRMDASTPGNDAPNDGRDLRGALDALLDGSPIASEQHPSMGCNIKWA